MHAWGCRPLEIMVSRACIASVVPFFFLPPYMLSLRRHRSAIFCTAILSIVLARIDWSCIGLQLFAAVYVDFLAFGMSIVLECFHASGMPWVHATFMVPRNSFSLSLLKSLSILVVIKSGPVAAPLGDCLMAALRLPMLSWSTGLCSIDVSGLLCSPPYSASWNSLAMCWCSAAIVLSFLLRAGIGCRVVLAFTVLKHSGALSSCKALAFASCLALAIAFLYALFMVGSWGFVGLLLTSFNTFLLWVSSSLDQKALAFGLARGVCLSVMSLSCRCTLVGSVSFSSIRRSSAPIISHFALSYLSGRSPLFLQLMGALTRIARWSADGMMR